MIVTICVAVDGELFSRGFECYGTDNAADKVMRYKQIEEFDSWDCEANLRTAVDQKLARLEWEAFDTANCMYDKDDIATILDLFERGSDDLKQDIREWIDGK